MFSDKLLLHRGRRQGGSANRKLPVARDVLIAINSGLTPARISGNIIFCGIFPGRYFAIRKIEYSGPGINGVSPNKFRRSVRAVDSDPYIDSKRVKWCQICDIATLHIHGIETDWLNCGVARTRAYFTTHPSDPKIFVVRKTAKLYEDRPGRFNLNAPTFRTTNKRRTIHRPPTHVSNKKGGREKWTKPRLVSDPFLTCTGGSI